MGLDVLSIRGGPANSRIKSQAKDTVTIPRWGGWVNQGAAQPRRESWHTKYLVPWVSGLSYRSLAYAICQSNVVLFPFRVTVLRGTSPRDSARCQAVPGRSSPGQNGAVDCADVGSISIASLEAKALGERGAWGKTICPLPALHSSSNGQELLTAYPGSQLFLLAAARGPEFIPGNHHCPILNPYLEKQPQVI